MITILYESNRKWLNNNIMYEIISQTQYFITLLLYAYFLLNILDCAYI